MTPSTGVDAGRHPCPSATASAASVRRRAGRFTRGSLIELAGGRWKRMEQMAEADFVHGCAALRRRGTQIELITVAHLLHNHDRNTVNVGFQLSSYETQARSVELSRVVCSRRRRLADSHNGAGRQYVRDTTSTTVVEEPCGS